MPIIVMERRISKDLTGKKRGWGDSSRGSRKLLHKAVKEEAAQFHKRHERRPTRNGGFECRAKRRARDERDNCFPRAGAEGMEDSRRRWAQREEILGMRRVRGTSSARAINAASVEESLKGRTARL